MLFLSDTIVTRFQALQAVVNYRDDPRQAPKASERVE